MSLSTTGEIKGIPGRCTRDDDDDDNNLQRCCTTCHEQYKAEAHEIFDAIWLFDKERGCS
jgi:hypothetical protein